MFPIPGISPGLAQITAQIGTVGFERGRHLQILPPFLDKAAMNFAQPAAQPRVPQGAIKGNGAIKRFERGHGFVSGREQETSERPSLCVARR